MLKTLLLVGGDNKPEITVGVNIDNESFISGIVIGVLATIVIIGIIKFIKMIANYNEDEKE